MGKVYIVGAGPGDPKLITIKGLELLKKADVILYDHLVNPRLLKEAKEEAEKIFVGKIAGKHTYRQEEINQLLIEKAKKFQCVVRLKGGDPFIFGRLAEEMEALSKAKIEFEVIPGVTASSGAASSLKTALTHRDISSVLTFITGHRKGNTPLDIPFEHIVKLKSTLVIYMGVRTFPEIREKLLNCGMEPSTPVAFIENATLEEEKIIVTTLEKAQEALKEIKPPAIIIIGKILTKTFQLNLSS